jgi:Icc-related predicted phosphoesterase
MSLKIVAVADTHGYHHDLTVPDGDVFIHAGDISAYGRETDLADFNDFLDGLPHRIKIVIAGNHDFAIERDPQGSAAILSNCVYLQDASYQADGVRFYGSPWQPWFHDWAFNLQRGAEIRAKWELIPEDTQVLITHGPPYGHGDLTVHGSRVGCRDLLEFVERIQPLVHVFGHIHEGYGITANEHTKFINASVVDQDFVLSHSPTVFNVDVSGKRVWF